MSSNPSIVLELVTPFILVAGLTGNIIVCFLIITNKKLRTSFNYLLLNLAVSDLLCSFLGTLFYAGQIRNHYFSDGELMRQNFEGTVCKVTTISIDLTTKNSVLTLAAISTDRYFAIVHPWRHRRAMVKRKIRFLLGGIWLLAVITCLPMILLMAKIPNTFQGNSIALCLSFLMNENSFKVVAFVDLIAAYIIPMAIILRTSLAIIKHLWCQPGCHCSRPPPEEASQMLLKSRKRITRIILSVIIAFNIFWLPWAILEGSLLIGALQRIEDTTFVIMLILVLSSASVNPILYSLQSRLFRNGVKKMFRCG
ncbi:allatostatin-A receptor-like [Oculina patagonica]